MTTIATLVRLIAGLACIYFGWRAQAAFRDAGVRYPARPTLDPDTSHDPALMRRGRRSMALALASGVVAIIAQLSLSDWHVRTINTHPVPGDGKAVLYGLVVGAAIVFLALSALALLWTILAQRHRLHQRRAIFPDTFQLSAYTDHGKRRLLRARKVGLQALASLVFCGAAMIGLRLV